MSKRKVPEASAVPPEPEVPGGPPEAEAPTHTVAPGRSLEHDGVRYTAGAPVCLSDEQAGPLLTLGVIHPATND